MRAIPTAESKQNLKSGSDLRPSKQSVTVWAWATYILTVGSPHQLTGVPHCAQHFPGTTQTVSPRSRQAGQRRPGTCNNQPMLQLRCYSELTGMVVIPSASLIQGMANLSMGACSHITLRGRWRCCNWVLDDMFGANEDEVSKEESKQE